MPALRNARRELFAQHIAEGKEIGDAYVLAGYKPDKGNPSTLRAKTEVDRRINYILEKRNKKILEKSAHEVETTRELILGELEEARQIAKRARNGSAMAMCSLGKAKVQGLIIDRREIGEAGTFDGKTDEELMEDAKAMAERLGMPAPGLRLVASALPKDE